MSKHAHVVTIDSSVFTESTLKIGQAIAVFDLLYVIACNELVEQLSERSLVNAMHTANQLLDDAYDNFSKLELGVKP